MWEEFQERRREQSDRTAANPPNEPRSSNPTAADQSSNPGMIKRFKHFAQELLSTPDKETGWGLFALPRALRIIKREKIDCIYTSTPPHSSHLIGWAAKKMTGLPFVADFRAPWSQNEYFIEDTPIHSLRRLEEKMELAIHRTADVVVGNSVSEADGYREKYAPLVGDKFFPILNGYDPDDFHTENSVSYEKFTVVYVGGLYGRRNPDLFFEGVNRFLKSRPEARENFKILFIGRDVSDAMKDVGLNDIIEFTGHLPQKEAFRYLFQANLLLMILGFDPRGKGVIPAKLSEYLPTGRPILAMVPEGETAGYLREYNPSGTVVTEPDAGLIESAIARYYADYEQRGNRSIEPRVAIIEPFTRRYQTGQLAGLLNQAIAATGKKFPTP
jgi:glycosyltransferase involved in cell wall biosynthesis